MPAAQRYIALTDKDYRELIDTPYQNEKRKRQQTIDLNLKCYENRFDDILWPDSTQVNDNVKVPLIQQAVNQDNARMVGVGDNSPEKGIRYISENSAAQEFIDALWRANDLNSTHLKLFRNGSLAGQVYVKIRPEAARDQQTNRKYPKIEVGNPRYWCTFWLETNMEEVCFYRWEYGNSMHDFVMNRDENGEALDGWIVYEYTRHSQSKQWELKRDIPWQYDFAPVYSWQNLINTADYYGYDDIGGLYNLNIAYNFTRSAQQRMVKYKATPITVVTGGALPEPATDEDGNPTGADMAADSVLTFPDAETKVYTVEMSSDALKPSMEHAGIIRRDFFDGMREIDSASISALLGKMSNFDLQILFGQALAKRETKILTAEPGLLNVIKACYALANGGNANVDIKVEFPAALPQNELEKTQALEKDVTVFGLDQDTALEERGYDPEEVRQRREVRRAESVGDQVAVAQAGAFGNVVQLGRAARLREQNMEPIS